MAQLITLVFFLKSTMINVEERNSGMSMTIMDIYESLFPTLA